MNDFTKSELIALEDAMEHMLEIHRPQGGQSPLQEKLISMIDNYCDHDWENTCCGCPVCAYTCTKCGINL